MTQSLYNIYTQYMYLYTLYVEYLYTDHVTQPSQYALCNMSEEVPIRHGLLIKRSVAKSVTTIKAKFQRRYFKLYQVK